MRRPTAMQQRFRLPFAKERTSTPSTVQGTPPCSLPRRVRTSTLWWRSSTQVQIPRLRTLTGTRRFGLRSSSLRAIQRLPARYSTGALTRITSTWQATHLGRLRQESPTSISRRCSDGPYHSPRRDCVERSEKALVELLQRETHLNGVRAIRGCRQSSWSGELLSSFRMCSWRLSTAPSAVARRRPPATCAPSSSRSSKTRSPSSTAPSPSAPPKATASKRRFSRKSLTATKTPLERRQALAEQKNKLLREQQRLLQAHYADAVPIELLKSEQDRIGEPSSASSRSRPRLLRTSPKPAPTSTRS